MGLPGLLATKNWLEKLANWPGIRHLPCAGKSQNLPSLMRIDKWLWAVRIFKTRSLASAACRSGQVEIAGQKVKPSREVKADDLITAKPGEMTRTVKVLGLPHNRVSATAAKEFMDDKTPASEFEKPREKYLKPLFYRPKGLGRPTKKDRREIEKII